MQKILDWLKCAAAKIFPVLDTNKDGVIDKDDFKYLEKKTKDELEALGRKIGIELDKRQTKAKLIAALKKAKKEVRPVSGAVNGKQPIRFRKRNAKVVPFHPWQVYNFKV